MQTSFLYAQKPENVCFQFCEEITEMEPFTTAPTPPDPSQADILYIEHLERVNGFAVTGDVTKNSKTEL